LPYNDHLNKTYRPNSPSPDPPFAPCLYRTSAGFPCADPKSNPCSKLLFQFFYCSWPRQVSKKQHCTLAIVVRGIEINGECRWMKQEDPHDVFGKQQSGKSLHTHERSAKKTYREAASVVAFMTQLWLGEARLPPPTRAAPRRSRHKLGEGHGGRGSCFDPAFPAKASPRDRGGVAGLSPPVHHLRNSGIRKPMFLMTVTHFDEPWRQLCTTSGPPLGNIVCATSGPPLHYLWTPSGPPQTKIWIFALLKLSC
jgi:hypothetical protein